MNRAFGSSFKRPKASYLAGGHRKYQLVAASLTEIDVHMHEIYATLRLSLCNKRFCSSPTHSDFTNPITTLLSAEFDYNAIVPYNAEKRSVNQTLLC